MKSIKDNDSSQICRSGNKVHFSPESDYKTACELLTSSSIRHTSNIADVNCRLCNEWLDEMIPELSKDERAKAGVIVETEGVRQNEGKPMLSPIDPMLLLEMGQGLAIGQARYGDKAFNKKGNIMKLTTCKDSLDRHVLKFMAKYDEDDRDPEDQIHHIAKAINCLVIMWHNRIQGDDR